LLLICSLAACGTSPSNNGPDASTAPDASDAAGVTNVPPPMLLFNPRVVLWLDAAAPGTVIAPTGAVERWIDRSGHGHDAVPVSVAAAPASATLAGTPAVTFDGADDHLVADAVFATRSRVMFAVAANHDATLPIPNHVSSVVSTMHCGSGTVGITLYSYASSAIERRAGTLVDGPLSHYLRVDSIGDGKVIAQDHWFVASLQMIPDEIGMPSLSLGSQVEGCQFGHVSIAEVIVLEGGAALNELDEVEKYLAAKWNVPRWWN
jgi:hypothetical protein